MLTRSAQSALLALAASVALAGCAAVGPNYERPKLPTPPAYRFVEAPAQAQSLADATWFQVFDDPALQALIREAIANNLDLRVALAHVEEARARAGIAKSYLYPQVDGSAAYGVRGASSTEENNDTTHQSGVYGFQLSWEIDLFGRLRRGQEAAIALALASEQGRRGVLVTLVGDVASNYFLLRELDLQLADRPGNPSPQRRNGRLFPEPSRTAAYRIVSSSTGFRPSARRPRPPSRTSSARWPWSRT